MSNNNSQLTELELRYIKRVSRFQMCFIPAVFWCAIYLIVLSIFPALWISLSMSVSFFLLGCIILNMCYFWGRPYYCKIQPEAETAESYFDTYSTGLGRYRNTYMTYHHEFIKTHIGLKPIFFGFMKNGSPNNKRYKKHFNARYAVLEYRTGGFVKKFYILLNVEDLFCIRCFYIKLPLIKLLIPSIIWVMQITYACLLFALPSIIIASVFFLFINDFELIIGVSSIIGIIATLGVIEFAPETFDKLWLRIPTPIDNNVRCTKNHFKES